jgi:hypothetical protein
MTHADAAGPLRLDLHSFPAAFLIYYTTTQCHTSQALHAC